MGRSRSKSRSASRDRSKSRDKNRKRSGSDQRDRSRSGSPSKSDDHDVEKIKITDDDAAFVLGKGGKTKEKIVRVSECEIELFERDLVIEFRGTKLQRKRAMKYSKCVMQQRTGPVSIDKEDADDDLSLLWIPQEAVGFVTGRGGNFLRSLEEEWRVIMFFCDSDGGRRGERENEKLAIFGASKRGRCGAELKVLSAVEAKVPGTWKKLKDEVLNREVNQNDSWGFDTMTFRDTELSYALGKQGATRRKIERASEAIVQYIGHTAVFAGFREERKRAKEYMKWLFDQLDGPCYVDGWEKRDDITVVEVPSDCIGYVTGSRRAALSGIEEEWGSLMFFMNKSGDREKRSGKAEQLAIFGTERARRGAELKVMSAIEMKSPGTFTKDLREKLSDEPGFATDRYRLRDDELSYALGKEGSTRKKLAKASNCVLQYVGHVAYMAGTLKERKRCKEFLDWLLEQRRGDPHVGDVSDRDDCLEMHIPSNCRGWVTGNRGSELRRVEQQTGTFIFMAKDDGDERLLIFGVDAGSKFEKTGRLGAEAEINVLVQDRLRRDSRGRSPGRGRSRSRNRDSRSPRRSCSRSRRRSRSRRHSKSRSRHRSRSRSRRRSPSRSRSRRR